MSEWHVEVCLLTNVEKHPNADTLSIGEVNGYPVIFRTDDHKEGDKVVHIPVDSITPLNDPRFEHLGKHNRIKPKRLRGIFSLGFITYADPSWEVGQDVSAELHVERYDPDTLPEGGRRGAGGSFRSGNAVKGPHLPIYDIEGYRKYKSLFRGGEEVEISEKAHGCSSKFMHDGEAFHVGSRKEWKDQNDTADLWVRIANKYDLKSKLATKPGFALYGEVYGQVQDLKYGAGQTDVFLAAFDVYDTHRECWLDVDARYAFCDELGIPRVKVLYRGPWKPTLVDLCEGMSTVPGANHVREGFVIKPVKERYAKHFGRVVLKMVGQGYHLRNNGLPPKEIQPEVDAAVARANAEMERILAGQDPEVEAAKAGLLTEAQERTLNAVPHGLNLPRSDDHEGYGPPDSGGVWVYVAPSDIEVAA